MKKLLFSLFGVTLLALPICAQSSTAVVNVPFEFAAGGRATLPAGQYVVNISAFDFPTTLAGPDGRTHLLTGWATGVNSATPTLVFHRYGNQYFLSEVRTGQRSRKFQMSRPELELKKMTTAPRSETIVLAMR